MKLSKLVHSFSALFHVSSKRKNEQEDEDPREPALPREEPELPLPTLSLLEQLIPDVFLSLAKFLDVRSLTFVSDSDR
jgi:hypothetical protein